MALTAASQYRAITPPGGYEHYGKSPAPLREGDDQKVMYWLDPIYLAEWISELRRLSEESGTVDIPGPAIKAAQLVPGGTQCDGAVLTPGSSGTDSLLGGLAKVGTHSGRSFSSFIVWVRPSAAKSLTKLDGRVDLSSSYRTPKDIEYLMLGATADEVMAGSSSQLLEALKGRLLMSGSLPVDEMGGTAYAEAVARIAEGRPITLNGVLGLFEACRMYRYALTSGGIKPVDLRTSVRSRDYSRDYDTRYQDGGWSWEISGGYTEGLVERGEYGTWCEINRGDYTGGTGGPPEADIVTGDSAGSVVVETNHVSDTESEDDDNGGSGLLLYSRSLDWDISGDMSSSNSRTYSTAEPTVTCVTNCESGENAGARCFDVDYGGDSKDKYSWRSYVQDYSQSVSASASVGPADGDVIECSYALSGTRRDFLTGEPYDGSPASIVKAYAYVTVSVAREHGTSGHDVTETYRTDTGSPEQSVTGDWDMPDGGWSRYPTVEDSGDYAVPVTLTASGDGRYTMSRRQILEGLGRIIFGDAGAQNFMDTEDFIARVSRLEGDLPEVFAVHGDTLYSLLPGTDVVEGSTVQRTKDGVAEQYKIVEDGIASYYFKNTEPDYSLTVDLSYNTEVRLLGVAALAEWNASVRV